MNKTHDRITEHFLVPAVLFLLNICLAHVIHALASGWTYSVSSKMILGSCLIVLAGSLFLKRQVVLIGSILFYVFTCLFV